MCATEEHMVSLVVDPAPKPKPNKDANPSPFVKPSGAATGTPAPMVSAKQLASDLGLTEITNLAEMSPKEKVAFYNALIRIDPDAKGLFPDPTKGKMPAGVHIMRGIAKLTLVDGAPPMSLVFRIYVDMQPEGSDPAYWHTTAIYPPLDQHLWQSGDC